MNPSLLHRVVSLVRKPKDAKVDGASECTASESHGGPLENAQEEEPMSRWDVVFGLTEQERRAASSNWSFEEWDSIVQETVDNYEKLLDRAEVKGAHGALRYCLGLAMGAVFFFALDDQPIRKAFIFSTD